MDPELLSTCKQGDVKKLIHLFETRSHKFFLAQENQSNSNILHILSSPGKQVCAIEALKRLPTQVVRQLVCQADSSGNNPLHLAAFNGLLDIAKLLVDAYKSSNDGADLPSPPWITKNNQVKLPVQVAVAERKDEVAAFLLSVDPNFLRNVDNATSLLRQSATLSCKQTARAILESPFEYSIEGFDPFYIVELAKNCSESHAVQLLERHPELFKCQDSSGKMTILRRATELNFVEIIKTTLHIDPSISYKQLSIGKCGPNPLHYAARLDRPQIAHLLIDGFNRSCKHQVERERAAPLKSIVSFGREEDRPAAASLLSFQPPWRQASLKGVTPLHDALRRGRIELAASMLLGDLAFLSDLADVYDNPQTVPVMEHKGFQETTERYLEPQVKRDFKDLYLKTFLKFLKEYPDKTKKLITQHPKLVEFKDASGRTILYYALDEDNVHIMRLILRTHPSAIDIQDEKQDHLLIKACREGKLSAIGVICALCPEVDARGKNQTTALHNVKLQNLKEYQSLLRIQKMAQLMNEIDELQRSPLIKAILDDNIHLSEALTERNGIDLTDIKSKDGKTAIDLLKDKSKGSLAWGALHKKVRKTNEACSIPLGTDLKEMKNTLSVVAALLATITFAAAFTVPGGFDQNNGDVLLGRRASLVVFILSDTYAMCCSLIVLYSLIWSIVWDSNDARALIGVCVYVLHQSLYGTLVAFMTGVYAVMSRKSLWAAIVICVMCSCVPLLASRRILVIIFYKFARNSRFGCCRGRKKYR